MTTKETQKSKMQGYAAGRKPIIEMNDIVKRFGTVSAIEGIDFNVYPGEVVAPVG